MRLPKVGNAGSAARQASLDVRLLLCHPPRNAVLL
jgi:hypothetical protein